MKAIDRTSGRELAGNLSVAATVLSRAKGLLGRTGLPSGEGLLIRPCKGVHTFFMKFPIDVLFLDKKKRVLQAVDTLQPYRMTRVLFSCDSVIELPAGTLSATGTAVGHEIVID